VLCFILPVVRLHISFGLDGETDNIFEMLEHLVICSYMSRDGSFHSQFVHQGIRVETEFLTLQQEAFSSLVLLKWD